MECERESCNGCEYLFFDDETTGDCNYHPELDALIEKARLRNTRITPNIVRDLYTTLPMEEVCKILLIPESDVYILLDLFGIPKREVESQ